MTSFEDESEFDFDLSSMLGMSSVLNKDETDNSINLKALEKDLFKKETFGFLNSEGDEYGNEDYENSDFNNQEESMVYDPVKEYNDIINSESSGLSRDNAGMEYNYTNNDSVNPANYEDNLTDEQASQNMINSYFVSNSSNDNTKNNYFESNENNKSHNE
jgi:hypothetical protein